MIHLTDGNDLPRFRHDFDRLVNYSPKFTMVTENISDRFSVSVTAKENIEQNSNVNESNNKVSFRVFI